MFLQHLEAACGEDGSMQQDSDRQPPFALLLMDLDRFKEVNDDYGHASGDAVLLAVSERLRDTVREGDIVARLGGDEFAIMLVSGSLEDAAMVAARLVELVSKRIKVGDSWVEVGASFGIAMFPRDGSKSQELLRNVDLALYEAKDGGKATFRVFEPTFGERFNDRVTLLSDLRSAIGTNQFDVSYQPIVDTQTGRVVSVEALARWNHPRRGAIPPATFIPLAEEAGLIASIGVFVLEEAANAASEWDQSIAVSVNLSPLQFKDSGLGQTIERILRKAGLPPNRLELEVTESAWLAVNQHTATKFLEMEAMGIKVVLDDFGTGFSSLSCLRQFRFHGLKIDAGFMRDVTRDPKAAAIVRMVASLAREMEITLTAEGIEQPDQMALVRECRIPRAQGYLLGSPMGRQAADAAFRPIPLRSQNSRLLVQRSLDNF